MFLEMDQTFVCVYDLFQIWVLISDEGKRMVAVILFVNTFDLI